VTFSLTPAQPGITITQTGATNELPNCDISSYLAETNLPVNPQPGSALTCLRYVKAREGERIVVTAQVTAPFGTIQSQFSVRLPISPTPSPTRTFTASLTPTVTETFTPTATGTVTSTGTITDTPTETPTPVDTGTATETATPDDTATPTVTKTPTATGTATETPISPHRVAAIGGAVRPGGTADVSFELADREAQVYDLSFDLLIDIPVFDVFQIASRCRTDPSLTTHQLSVTLAFDPFVPAGKRRFRFVLISPPGQVNQLREGPLVQCSLPVAADAPLGGSVLQVDRLLAGDRDGNLLTGNLPVNGLLIVDPNAPLPTETATATPTRTVTDTPTASPTRTATPTFTATHSATPTPTATDTPSPSPSPIPTDTPLPSPTPTPTETPLPSATPIRCPGDCNGDGAVAINELVAAVNIALGTNPVETCPAADRSGDGNVTIDEIVPAVTAAAAGCP
jgi:type VI secretion system secreted protein VgrG